MKTFLLKSAIASTVTALCLLPGAAQAHRTWLLPSSTQIEDKDPWVTIDAAVSENLFEIDTQPARLDGLSVLGPDAKPVSIGTPYAGKQRASFDIKLAKPGTYKISVANESILANYKLNGEMKRWRGSVEAFAKEVPANAEALKSTRTHARLETWVSAGKPNQPAFPAQGTGLELLPLTHPNETASGQASRFKLLLNGKPLAAVGVSVIPGGVRYRGVLQEVRVNTDAQGEFAVTWPQAGMYWLNVGYPARGEEAPDGRRYSYAATLEVLPQ